MLSHILIFTGMVLAAIAVTVALGKVADWISSTNSKVRAYELDRARLRVDQARESLELALKTGLGVGWSIQRLVDEQMDYRRLMRS